MAHFKRTLTVSLQDLAKVVHGVQTVSTIVATLTTTYQVQHVKLAHMVRVLLAANARALGWVPVATDEYIPYRQAVDGVVFRVIPDQLAIDGEYVLREWLEPFVPEDMPIYIDTATRPCQTQGPDVLVLDGWFASHTFRHGDHLIVHIHWRSRCELRLHIDRRVAQRIPDTVLIAGDIAAQLTTHWHATHDLELVQTRLLALYADAPWRNAYPPMPWQSLLNAQSAAPVVVSRLDLLRLRINDLQQLLRQRRKVDSQHGLWDGIALRYSAVRMFIDTQYDDTVTPRVVPVDMLLDHTHAIDDAIARGVYDVQYADSDDDESWTNNEFDDDDEPYTAALQSADDEDALDDMFWSDEDLDRETFVALFAHRHPALHAWSVQLLQALNDEERRMMLRAETDEDHTAILSAAMQRILPLYPHLMQTLRPTPLLYTDETRGGLSYAAFELAELRAAQHVEDAAHTVTPEHVTKSIDGDAVFVIELALRESQAHIRAYEEWCTTAHPRCGALRQRIRVMQEFALFLAQYYTTSLTDASYAMLDEYLFFHYPRHTTSGSARMLRLRIGYIRDYYAYRARLGDTRVLPFAQAMYACRQQAGDVLDLLLRIQQYPRELTALVVHLFAPYTL